MSRGASSGDTRIEARSSDSVPADVAFVAAVTRKDPMSIVSRRSARLAAQLRQPRTFDPPRLPDGHRAPVSAYFAHHVLDLIKLRERLPREAYQSLVGTLRNGH